jgi:hypothetical protein
VLAVDRGVLRRPRLVAAALGTCLGVTALLYLELPLRAGPFPAALVYDHPDTWSGFWGIVLARQFQGSFALFADLPTRVLDLADFAGSQLGILALIVPLAFVVTALRHPRYALLSGTATAVTCLFAAAYLNANIGRYYLGPALFAWSWLAVAAGAGIEVVFDRARSHPADDEAFDLAPAPRRLSQRASVALAVALALLVPTAAGLPDRWQAADRSNDTIMADWLDDAMTMLEPDAVVVSWWSYSTTLWYGQRVEGRRADILIVDDSNIVNDGLGSAEDVIDEYLGARPVYVIRSTPSDIDALAVRYVLEPVGRPTGVYRVTGPQETQP